MNMQGGRPGRAGQRPAGFDQRSEASGAAGDSVRWRALRPTDAGRLAELEVALFAQESPWPASALAAEISALHTFYVGCELPGAASEIDGPPANAAQGLLVGYAGIGRLGPEASPEYEVHTVGVDPRFQGRGLGRGLMLRLLEAADRSPGPVFLEVRADNEAAKSLYLSLGFEFMGLRKGYYQPIGADAWTMRREPGRSRPAPCPR